MIKIDVHEVLRAAMEAIRLNILAAKRDAKIDVEGDTLVVRGAEEEEFGAPGKPANPFVGRAVAQAQADVEAAVAKVVKL